MFVKPAEYFPRNFRHVEKPRDEPKRLLSTSAETNPSDQESILLSLTPRMILELAKLFAGTAPSFEDEEMPTPVSLSEPPLLLSAAELAELLGVSARHVWRLRDAGELPAPIRLGRLVRWRRSTVES